MNPLTDHVKLIQQLASVHQPFGWTDDSVDGYLLGLGDLPINVFRQVVVTSIQTGDKMPAPATLRRAALEIVAPNRPPSVEVAWHEVESQFGTVGRVGTPRWSHPLVGEAQRRTGSWTSLCNLEDLKDAKWTFRSAYKDLVERAEHAAMKSRGLSDTAALNGVETSPPSLIPGVSMAELEAATDRGEL